MDGEQWGGQGSGDKPAGEFPSSCGSLETLCAQVYFPVPGAPEGTYREEDSARFVLAPGEWREIELEIPCPDALRSGRLRFDPLNTNGFFRISGIKLVNAASGSPCWAAGPDYPDISPGKDILVLASRDTLEAVATGDDPQLFLPALPALPDCPMFFQLWIKASRSQDELHAYWREKGEKEEEAKEKESAVDELNSRLAGQKQDFESLQKRFEEETGQLEDKLEAKEKSIRELGQKLRYQEDLTREYFHALAEVETEQVEFITQVRTLERENRRLRGWIERLNRLFKALSNSRRWRLGDALGRLAGVFSGRRGRSGAVERINEVFDGFEKYIESGASTGQTGVEGRRIIKWLERLDKDFRQIMGSRSWKVGNSVVNIASAAFLRRKKPASVERIKGVLKEYRQWRKTANPAFLSRHETKRLRRWMKRLEKDLESLLCSRRWRAGKILTGPARALRGRGSRPAVEERIADVFRQYKSEPKHGK